MLSFNHIFAPVPVEQPSDALTQQLDQGEPVPLELDLLAEVSGGKSSIPVGGW